MPFKKINRTHSDSTSCLSVVIIHIIRTGNSPGLRQRRERKDLDCSQAKRGRRNRINRFSLLALSVGLPPTLSFEYLLSVHSMRPDAMLALPSAVAWFLFTKATSCADFIPLRLPLLDGKLPEGRVYAISVFLVLRIHSEDWTNICWINEWICVVAYSVIPAIPQLDLILPIAQMRRASGRCERTRSSSREQSGDH